MMIKGGIRIGGLGILQAFDPDASAYFATAGITDATAKTQINLFVRGVKDLGLWSSIVSWPLRTAQNAGSGLIAYSLGGLGTFDGTMTSITRDADGYIFNGSTSKIVTTLNSVTSDHTSISVSKYNSTAGNQAIIAKDDVTNRQFNHISDGSSIAPQVFNPSARSMFVGSPALSSYNYITLRNSASLTNCNRNGEAQTTATAGTMNGGSASFYIGSLSNSIFFFNGLIPFASVINSYVSDSARSDLYSLYKITLGTGLGLP
jgi:hypothetical protein